MAEVAQAVVALIPSTRGWGRQVENQIGGDTDRAGRNTGRRFGGAMSSGIGGVGAKMFAPIAAGIAAVGIGSFFKDAISGASDLSESASKVGVVFGKKFAPAIVKASESAAKSMGLSKTAYLDATGGLGNLLVSLDIAPKKAANMSQQMVRLAGDLASFNNVSPEEALAALQSGLTGETEPLKKFGVNMNDATLKTQALKMHLIKSTKEAMSPQTKALAAQALIMAQTGTAQGDFARTSGGLANQQRIAAAQTEDLKTKIGAGLLPIYTKLVTFMNANLGSAFSKVVEFMKPIGTLIMGTIVPALQVFFSFLNGNDTGVDGPFREMAVAGAFLRGVLATLIGFIQGQVVPAIQQLVGGFIHGTDALGSSQTKFAQWGAVAFQVFTTVKDFIITQVVPAFMRIVTAVQGFVAVALPIVQAFVAGMMARIGPMMPTIRNIFATIGSIIVGALGLIQAVIQRVTTVIAFIWNRWGKNIMDFIATVFGGILRIIQAALRIIQGVIKTVTSLIKGDWSGVWDGIKAILAGVWDGIKAIISTALSIVKGILSGAWGLIKAGASAAWDGIKGLISRAWDAIKTAVSGKIRDTVALAKALPGQITSALGNVGSMLFEKGKAIIGGLIDGIKSMARPVTDAVSGIVGKVASLLPGSPVKEGPLQVLNRGYAGGQIVKMLADGVTSEGGLLASSMSSLLQVPAVGSLDFASSGQRAGAVGAAGGGVNFYGNVGWDPDEVASRIATRQRDAQAVERIGQVYV